MTESKKETTGIRPGWIVIAFLWLSAAYLWILPIFRPRGALLWGHHSLKDIYLGIPVGLAMLCATVVWLLPARHRRPLGFRMLLLCLSVMGTLFALDAVYAVGIQGVWRPDYWLDQAFIPRKYSTADPELGFVRKPEISWVGQIPGDGGLIRYRTDENGFRNETRISHTDVVFLGDSFTEAAQVAEEDTFVQQVAAASKLKAVNLGRGAYGPQQELIVLRRYGLSYNPRLIVWQLFEGNDLDDAENFVRWRENPTREARSFKSRYLSNSLLNELFSVTAIPTQDRPVATLRLRNGENLRISVRYRYEPDAPSELSQAFAETSAALEQGYRSCEAKGVRMVVVFIPTMVRALEPWITFDSPEQRLRHLPAVDAGEKDFAAMLAGFCKERGIPFLEIEDSLRRLASEDNRRIYIPIDEHLDVRGHQAVAQAVLEWMKSQPMN